MYKVWRRYLGRPRRQQSLHVNISFALGSRSPEDIMATHALWPYVTWPSPRQGRPKQRPAVQERRLGPAAPLTPRPARGSGPRQTSAPLGYLYEGHEQTRYPYRFLSIEKSSYFHVDLSSVGERKTSDSSLKNVSVTDGTLGGIAMRSTLFPKVSLGIIKYL